MSQQLADYVDAAFDLTLAEFRVLGALAELKAASVKDIAGDASLDKAHVTRAIALLTRRKLVHQIVDREDRRLRLIRLTPAGEALYRQTEPFMLERHKRLASQFTNGELKVFWNVLRAIAAQASVPGDLNTEPAPRVRKNGLPTQSERKTHEAARNGRFDMR